MRQFLFLLLAAAFLLCCEAKRRYTSGAIRKGGKKRVAAEERDDDETGEQPVAGRDAFGDVAEFLHSSGGKAFKKFKYVEVRRAVAKLAASQSALKTMDGATHHFVNAFKEASTLAARHARFLGTDKPKRKEAAKLYEYVTTVERSLQAAEILQATRNTNDAERVQWLLDSGLEELKRVVVEHNGLACVVSVLRPLPVVAENDDAKSSNSGKAHAGGKNNERKQRTAPKAFAPGELVVSVVELGDAHQSLSNALRAMKVAEVTVPLKAVGFVSEEATLQPTLLALAVKGLEQCKEVLLAPPTATAAVPPQALRSDPNATETTLPVSAAPASTPPAPSVPRPEQLRFVGYSAGGAVAAYMALILDGSLASSHELLSPCTPFSAAFSKRVQCICLAPPPCLSRTLVPKFVTSILCGDDLVPRASPDSIARLKDRVLAALNNGAGKSGLASGLGGLTSWVGDLSAVASRSLQQYSAGQHDLAALAVPGRVFYCKSRSLQNGASIQRVMRGNWREDVLWLLHDILLSAKMAEHHSLDYYVRCLSRL